MADLPAEIIKGLSGKRFALIGFKPAEGKRISLALEQAQAFARLLSPSEAPPGSEELRPFDMVVLNLGTESKPSPWMVREALARNRKPLLLVGSHAMLLQQSPEVREFASDFLITPCRPEEILLRAFRILSESAKEAEAASKTNGAQKVRVIVADDDATTASLVRATLQKYDMECHVARDGGEALEMTKDLQPDALVLDINMPHLDGFEVLASLRGEERTRDITVVLLTARQQETDILRGFGLGADDYIIKPFSPMELVARLKRLLKKN